MQIKKVHEAEHGGSQLWSKQPFTINLPYGNFSSEKKLEGETLYGAGLIFKADIDSRVMPLWIYHEGTTTSGIVLLKTMQKLTDSPPWSQAIAITTGIWVSDFSDPISPPISEPSPPGTEPLPPPEPIAQFPLIIFWPVEMAAFFTGLPIGTMIIPCKATTVHEIIERLVEEGRDL
jgi:hypothetical protein